MTQEGARIAAERAARESYGRLLAFVTARTRNIAAAEDALAEAFASALSAWPKTGVPDRPEAWLLTTARRAAGHADRRRKVRDAHEETVAMIEEDLREGREREFPDERLKLLFACAHPAIGQAVRTPLMLQTVLGLDAARIAIAFNVAATAMGQRLVRAKAKIREAAIPFSTPKHADLPERLEDVLSAIYACFSTGWDEIGGAQPSHEGLAEEAIFLGRLVVSLLPEEPEPKGLLALMLYADARKAARRDAKGAYVPLIDQDRSLWAESQIIEAERLLTAAAQAKRFGRFQAEAALQSVHVQAGRGVKPNSSALVTLYNLLARFHPTIGVEVGRAVAHAAHYGVERGLAMLDSLDPVRAEAYQPFHAARFHLLAEAGRQAEAEDARARAVELARDPAIVRYLEGPGPAKH
jgi:RNA polymerase sigma-70 factor (ECF subfamily)